MDRRPVVRLVGLVRASADPLSVRRLDRRLTNTRGGLFRLQASAGRLVRSSLRLDPLFSASVKIISLAVVHSAGHLYVHSAKNHTVMQRSVVLWRADRTFTPSPKKEISRQTEGLISHIHFLVHLPRHSGIECS